MNKLGILITLILLIASLGAEAQSNDKIEKVLSELYQKGKVAKCEKKALKFKSKNPKAPASYLFLSKIEIYTFKQFPSAPNKKQYSHLSKATKYAFKVKDDYAEWFNEIEGIYNKHINSWPNVAKNDAHLRKLHKNFNKYFKDSKPAIIETKPVPEPVIENTHPEIKYNSKRKTIIKTAEALVGIPYKYAGTNPKTGFDCSGFTQYLYKKVDINVPHNSHMQSQLNWKIVSIKDAQPGDLIIFGSGNTKNWNTQHTGIIYANTNGNLKVIHSVSRGVTIDGDNPSWESYWKEKILFIKRLPE